MTLTRSLMLLMTLIMISFSLSIMPLDVKSFEINFDNVFKPIDTPVDTAALPSSFTIKSVSSMAVRHFNPQDLFLKVDALESPPESWTPLIAGNLSIMDNRLGTEVKHMSETELLSILTLKADNNNLSADLNLNVSALNLHNGSYKVILNFINPSLTKSFEYDIHVFNVLPYASERNSAVQNAMMLYYPDASRQFLVPVYKPLASTDRMIRSSLNALLEVPKGFGLYETPVAPRISRADFTGGVTKCSLLTRDLSTTLTDSDADLAFQSMAKTLFAVKSSYVINQVEFILDGNERSVFKSTDLSKPYVAGDNASAFVPYSSAGKVLLVPVEVGASDPNTAVASIFKSLRGEALPDGLDPLLPHTTTLKDHRIEGRNLVLNFNSDFKTLYYKQPHLQIMLLDALSLSFSSIEGIDAITIQVDGSNFSGWEGAQIQNPLSPPPFFNLVP